MSSNVKRKENQTFPKYIVKSVIRRESDIRSDLSMDEIKKVNLCKTTSNVVYLWKLSSGPCRES